MNNIPALSIRQPWAWLIIRPDLPNDLARTRAMAAGQVKDIENRTWKTRHRGDFLVHASAGMTRDEYEGAAQFAARLGVTVPPAKELQRGGIVGVVDLHDCLADCESSWYMGAIGFKLRNPRPLPFTPLKGALGFFKIPEDLQIG